MRRADSDIVWRAAMGLVIGGPTPSERTMRDFEAFLRERDRSADLPRYLLLHEHFVHLALWSGCSNDPKWAMDSTPQYCYGAVLDTVRLLGDGLRLIARSYASATGTTVVMLADRWKLPLLLAKSTKGHLAIDWRNQDERSRVITELAGDVTRIVGMVRQSLDGIKNGPRKLALISRCDAAIRVVEQDLEATSDGRLVIAQKVAKNRVISITDPEARHGRKSKSQTFNGFKVNVLGDLVSGLIAGISVTPGNGHDAPPGHELIARATRMRLDLRQVLADTAYGGAADRHKILAEHGVRLVAPPPAIADPEPDGAIPRSAFSLDFEAMSATCPNQITTTDVVRVEDHAEPHLRFRWPLSACAACPMRLRCLKKRQTTAKIPPPDGRTGRPTKFGRVVDLHPFEQELREARTAWLDPAVRLVYRDRTQAERLISQVVRHGGRVARAWGRSAASLQAHAIAMRCNLELVARQIAAIVHPQAKIAA